MSPQARALLARFERLASQFAPNLRRALIRAFREIQDSLSEAAMVRLLQDGVEDLVQALVEITEQATARFRTEIRGDVAFAARSFRRDVPKSAEIGIVFDILNPQTIEAIRILDTRVMERILGDLRETVRAHVAAGLQDGLNPRSIARGLRDILPLAPNQAEAVRHFERMLRAGDRLALTRALRDKRFDGTLRRAFAGDGLTEAQIRNMVRAYRRKMIAFNAETIARTATLDALRLGQRLSWLEAVRAGFIDGDRLMKERVTVGDSRVREEHALIDGEIVPADAPYSNGEIVSGDQSYNCRCVDRMFLARAA